MKQLKSECDNELKISLEKLTSEYEDKLRFEKLTHGREMEKLRADHDDVVERLKEEMTQLQEQLSQIEFV